MNSDQKIIKPILADILQIPNTNDWDIYDKVVEEGLYLVHYNRNANLKEFGHVRGIIINIETKKIVCASYGYTPGLICDEINFSSTSSNDEGIQIVQDEDGNNFILKEKDLEFRIGLEGAIIRIWKSGEKVYYSSHRKIEIRGTKSRWGTSIPFYQMLEKLNMVNENVFFPEPSIKSSVVHLIMITHPNLLHGCKDLIGEGYLSYLDNIQMDPNYDEEIYLPSNLTNDLALAKEHNHLYHPESISIEQVNKHLKYGFNENYKYDPNDIRLGFGEYVVAINKTNKNYPINCMRIQSTPYTWRLNMRDNGINPLRQYFILLNSSHIDTTIGNNINDFKNKFPILNKYDVSSIKKLLIDDGRIIREWKQDNTSNSSILTYEDRIYNIWACYLMASPFHTQRDVAKMFDFYNDNKIKLIDYIHNIYLTKNYKKIENIKHGNYIKEIITSSIKMTKKRLYKNGVYQILEKDDYNNMIKESIRVSLLMREESINYRMMKLMIENK